jgi:hypothetical protein
MERDEFLEFLEDEAAEEIIKDDYIQMQMQVQADLELRGVVFDGLTQDDLDDKLDMVDYLTAQFVALPCILADMPPGQAEEQQDALKLYILSKLTADELEPTWFDYANERLPGKEYDKDEVIKLSLQPTTDNMFALETEISFEQTLVRVTSLLGYEVTDPEELQHLHNVAAYLLVYSKDPKVSMGNVKETMRQYLIEHHAFTPAWAQALDVLCSETDIKEL